MAEEEKISNTIKTYEALLTIFDKDSAGKIQLLITDKYRCNMRYINLSESETNLLIKILQDKVKE